MKLCFLNCSDDSLSYINRVIDGFIRNQQKAKRARALHNASLNIINECNTDCGENIGGTAAPTAPEVAAGDDDSDGDGDGDPEPERRARRRPSRTSHLFTVEHFDRLPDSAHIDIATLRVVTGKSRATLYRWMTKGILPKPRKLGLTHNFWTAGEIRRALQG